MRPLNAALAAKKEILAVAARELDRNTEELTMREGKIYAADSPEKSLTFTRAVNLYQTKNSGSPPGGQGILQFTRSPFAHVQFRSVHLRSGG